MKNIPVTIETSDGQMVETTVEDLAQLAEGIGTVWCERRKGKRIRLEYCRSGRCSHRSCPHWARGKESVNMEKTKDAACEAILELINKDWYQFRDAIERSDKGEGTINLSVKVEAGAAGKNELTVTMSFVKEKRKWKIERRINENQMDLLEGGASG